MREREVEVDDLVFGDLADLGDHRDDRAVVAMGEHAALRRTRRAGGVDEGERILGADGRAARLELLRRAPASALAHLVERYRTKRLDRRRAVVLQPRRWGGSITMIVRSCGRRSRIAAIFASWSSSSQTIAQASESESTQWHSSGEFVW